MYHNSSLPKLLAKENISIRHGNYQTPWFDIKNRVLGLPMWKDMGKDVYDLFVGHEVGHALETPYEGWHDSPEKLQGCPRSYINVIEDARIERKVKSRYPGLVGPFSRAYSKLYSDNFFGTETIDMDRLKVIDKINLQAKVGSHIEIDFTEEEQVFMDRAMTTEDFQEVLELVKDVVAYDKANEEEEEDPQTSEPDNSETSEEQEQQQGNSSGDTEESSDEDDTPAESSDSDSEGEDSYDEDQKYSTKSSGGEDICEALTDNAFRENESSLLDMDEGGFQVQAYEDISKPLREKIIISYKQLKEERLQALDIANSYVHDKINEAMIEYPTFMKGVKRSVAIATREFEMKKAATQWAKATTAKTGVIDVNKLFSYKTNDDIFKQNTRLHDAKSHGMIMLIDYSGSMYDSLPEVLEQLIHLVLFCKQVQIPFDVYAFTSTNKNLDWYEMRNEGLLCDGDIDLDMLAMPNLVSSKMKKADFEDAIKNLYLRSKVDRYVAREMCGKSEDFGSTPLDQALIVAHHLIKEFKIKNQVEVMNLVTFTDGDANQMSAYHDDSLKDNKVPAMCRWKGGCTFRIDGKIVHSSSRNTTESLLLNIRKRYFTNTIGFFMADDNKHFNSKVDDVFNKRWSGEERQNAQKEYRKNKCVVYKDALGYNDFYLIKGGSSLSTQDAEFEVSSDQSRGQMASAFKKYSKSKKQNKVLMTTFGRAVA